MLGFLAVLKECSRTERNLLLSAAAASIIVGVLVRKNMKELHDIQRDKVSNVIEE